MREKAAPGGEQVLHPLAGTEMSSQARSSAWGMQPASGSGGLMLVNGY